MLFSNKLTFQLVSNNSELGLHTSQRIKVWQDTFTLYYKATVREFTHWHVTVARKEGAARLLIISPCQQISENEGAQYIIVASIAEYIFGNFLGL